MRFTVILEREEDGGYHAFVPALPGCHSQGDSLDEAERNIREAIELYLEGTRATGEPSPNEDAVTSPIETVVELRMESGERFETVWTFNGLNAYFPCAVFRTQDEAVAWIRQHKLSGTLTEYPVGISCYDWAIKYTRWRPTKPHHSRAECIQRFSPSLRHFHFEDGE